MTAPDASPRHHEAAPPPAAPGAVCASCGYPLGGLPSGRCPECGGVAPAPAESVGRRTAHGLMWMMTGTVATKLTSMLMQWALAWLLLKDAWGLVGMAYTVSTFATLVQSPGIEEILVQRQAHFRRWATPAFWMSLACGVVGGLLMVGAAPLAAWAYGEPALVPLLAVMALGSPIANLSTVPRARLRSQLRFRSLTVLTIWTTLLTQALTVLFAWLGWGPYAFVAPQPIVAVVSGVALWRMAPERVGRTPKLRRWRYMLGDSAAMFGTGVLSTLTGQGDRMVLAALVKSAATVGLYFFAFTLALQTTRLLAGNLTQVLFPSLGRFAGDPARQGRAALSATRILALAGMPLCFLQAAVAGPAVRALFHHRWDDAIVLVQLFSVAMAFDCVGWPGMSLGQALGRFKSLMWLFAGATAVYFGMIVLGALAAGPLGLRPEVGIGAGVTVYYIAVSCAGMALILSWAGVPARELAAIYPVPLLGGGAAALAGWWVARQLPGVGPWVDWARVGVTGAVFAGAYAPIAWFGAPSARAQLVSRALDAMPAGVSRRLPTFLTGPRGATT